MLKEILQLIRAGAAVKVRYLRHRCWKPAAVRGLAQ